MGIVTIATLLWYGGNLVLVDKTLEGSLFLVYMLLSYNILTPAKNISKASYAVKNGLAAAERVFEILEQENPIESKIDAIEKNTFESVLSIKNINFKYNNEYVLKDFSLEVKKGQTIASLEEHIYKIPAYCCDVASWEDDGGNKKLVILFKKWLLERYQIIADYIVLL